MSATIHFTYEKDWRTAPIAFWVHMPVAGNSRMFEPPAPAAVPHKGYVFLLISFESYNLQFSAPAQLDHMIDVLASRPLPTSRQLSARRGPGLGPNGHWLSRLPAALKSPRKRERLVKVLQAVRASAVGPQSHTSFRPIASRLRRRQTNIE